MGSNEHLVGQRFRLDEQLSDRPTGAVYRAWDTREDRAVAVKAMRSPSSAEERARFLREASALKKLDHPCIARHVESGIDERYGPFLVTEWVEGEDMDGYLKEGPFDLLTGVEVARKLASALSHVHGRGLLHRDIKPGNVRFRAETREVRLIDFGLARAFGAGADTMVTEPGQFLGTPRYVSPEQARGEPALDPRSDVFSLGGVLYRGFSGRPAFDAPNLRALLYAVTAEPHVPLAVAVPEFPPRLSELIDAMLEKDPEARPAHGQAVLDALDEISVSMEVGARRLPALDWGRPHVPTWRVRGEVDGRACVPPLSAEAVERIARSFELEARQGGSAVWLLEHSAGSEIVEAGNRIARCVLAIREAWPRARALISTLDREGAPSGSAARGGAFEGIELDANIARLLVGSFDIEARGEHRILLGPRIGVGFRGRAGRSRFTGRSREVDSVIEALRSSVERRMVQVVAVSGGPGLGKTRLRYELLRDRAFVDLDPFIILCIGEPGGRAAALRAFARGLRVALGLGSHFSRSRLAAALVRVCGQDPASLDPSVVEPLYQALSTGAAQSTTLLDATLSWDASRRGIYDITRKIVARRPLVVVVDDVQHVDAPSLKLVEDLVRVLCDEPFVVLLLSRAEGPEHLLAAAPSGAIRRVELSPLDVESTRAMARAGLDEDASASQVERIAMLSGGNPRVVEELVEAAQLGVDASAGPVLQQWFESCILSLRRQERAALRAAAIFGERFPKAGVQRILRGSSTPAELGASLERLVQLSLVRPTPDDGDGPDAFFRFTQPVLVRLLQEGLTPEEVRDGHLVAAEHLALNASDEPAVVAAHFVEAEEARAASIWCHRAAKHALRAEDLEGALELADRGYGLAADDDIRGPLLLVRAEARLWLGDPVRAAIDANEAVERLPRLSTSWAQALCVSSTAALRTGDGAAHRGLAAEAEELLKDFFISTPTLSSVVRLASDAVDAGEVDSVLGLYERIAILAQGSLDGPAVVAPFMTLRGTLARTRGEFDAAVADYRAAVAKYAEAGRPRAAAMAGLRLADLLLHASDTDSARFVLDEILRDARLYGWRSLLPEALSQHAWIRLSHGDTGAVGDLQLAAKLAEGQGDRAVEVRARVYLSRALRELGRVDEAEVEASRSVDLSSRAPAVLALALAELAACQLAAKRAAPALRFIQAALRACAGSRLGELEERARLTQTRALMALGRTNEAAVAARRGLELFATFAAHVHDARIRTSYMTTVFRAQLLILAKDLEVG